LSWNALQNIDIGGMQHQWIHPADNRAGYYKSSTSWRLYYDFPAWTTTKFVESRPGQWIQLLKVYPSVDTNKYALRIKWTLHYRTDYDNLASLTRHSECVYYKVQKSTPTPPSSNYCWDGIIQNPNSHGEKEQCDFWGNASDWVGKDCI